MKKLLRTIIPPLYIVLLAIPALYFFSARTGLDFFTDKSFAASAGLLFPLLGLCAITLLWAQLIIGSTMNPLRRLYPAVEKFHHAQGLFVLLFALVHPLLLIISLGIAGYLDLLTIPSSLRVFVWLGEFQLLLLIIAALTASLRKISWLTKHWHWVHLANYIVFFSALIHSWFLGSDVTSSSLKYVWITFGVTGLAASLAKLWRYTKLRKLIKNKRAGNNLTSPEPNNREKTTKLAGIRQSS